MAKAKTKEVLTPQERVDLFAKEVKALSEKYQIGLVTVLKYEKQALTPDLQFVDLIQKTNEQIKAN